MWAVNFILICGLVVWNAVTHIHIKTYDNKQMLGNIMTLEDNYYKLYGFEGAGHVREKYPVYYPVFIAQNDLTELENEYRVVAVNYQESLKILDKIKRNIQRLKQQNTEGETLNDN